MGCAVGKSRRGGMAVLLAYFTRLSKGCRTRHPFWPASRFRSVRAPSLSKSCFFLLKNSECKFSNINFSKTRLFSVIFGHQSWQDCNGGLQSSKSIVGRHFHSILLKLLRSCGLNILDRDLGFRVFLLPSRWWKKCSWWIMGKSPNELHHACLAFPMINLLVTLSNVFEIIYFY